MHAFISAIISNGFDDAPAVLGLAGATIAAIVARHRRRRMLGRTSRK